MPVVPNGRRAVLLAVGVLAAGSLYVAGGAAADPPPTTTTTYSSECEARLLSLTVGDKEAASFGAKCHDKTNPKEGGLPPIGHPSLPVNLRLLYETTTWSSGGVAKAEAGVAQVAILLNGPSGGELPDITVEVLVSKASCENGVATGSSKVVNIAFGASKNSPAKTIALPEEGPFVKDFAPLPLVIKGNQSQPSQKGPVTTGVPETGTTTTTTRSLTQTALEVHALGGTPAPAIDLIVSRTKVDCATRTVTTPPPPPPPIVGWMTGGGQLPDNITHSLVLPCTPTQKSPGPKLHVETPSGKFTLTDLDGVGCSLVGKGPRKPAAGFDTLSGHGKGSCNGGTKVPITFTFTDGGEPNHGSDKASVKIDPNNDYGCRVDVAGDTVNGNHQAHKGKNPPA